MVYWLKYDACNQCVRHKWKRSERYMSRHRIRHAGLKCQHLFKREPFALTCSIALILDREFILYRTYLGRSTYHVTIGKVPPELAICKTLREVKRTKVFRKPRGIVCGTVFIFSFKNLLLVTQESHHKHHKQ